MRKSKKTEEAENLDEREVQDESSALERIVEYTEADLVDTKPVPELNLEGIKTTAFKKPRDPNSPYRVAYCEPSEAFVDGCLNCGSIDFHKNGYAEKDRVVHDVNMGLLRIDLVLKVPRYLCNDCGGTFRHPFTCIPENTQATNRLIEQMKQEALVYTFAEVAAKFGYTEGTVRRVFDGYVKELDALRGQITAPRVLGIDEKHIAKKMRGIFVDIETGMLLEMTPDNKKATMIGMIEGMADYDTNIKIVTMDMSNGYRAYIQECLPDAKIIVDKWHIYDALRKRVKAVKTAIMEKIHADLDAMKKDDPEKQRLVDLRNQICHNSYLFRFSTAKLTSTPNLASLMAEVCETFPEFNHLRLLKDGFIKIYEQAATRQEAEKMYAEWVELVPPKAKDAVAAWEKKYGVKAELYDDMRTFLNTTKSWHEEIFGYFDEGCRYTNAATEGQNRAVSSVDVPGSGYGFESLRGKCLYGPLYNSQIAYRLAKTKSRITLPEVHLPAALHTLSTMSMNTSWKKRSYRQNPRLGSIFCIRTEYRARMTSTMKKIGRTKSDSPQPQKKEPLCKSSGSFFVAFRIIAFSVARLPTGWAKESTFAG